jgi:hypothetical protein
MDTMIYLLLLFGCTGGYEPMQVDTVDIVEINHNFEPKNDGLVFDQIIWWEDCDRGFQVVDWRILRDVRAERKIPRAANETGPTDFLWKHACPTRENGKWISIWRDEKTHKLRKVIADTLIETWTYYDPELEDRQLLPDPNRRKLR